MLNFEKTRTEFQEILAKPIRELGLKLEGSPLERFVQQLYRELEAKGLHKFRPPCYLTDEWGCPSGEPVIGIPFYLANPDLAQLERDMNDLEDAREIMMYMRHEAGHAFNYAYQLYKSAEWRDLFGPFRRAYRDNYRPIPFSRKFVRHMAGWYAQKHPDEDFAETFAVWLTPRSQWRKRYHGWGALAKLQYVDRVARRVGDVEPIRRRGRTDITVDEMESTVGEFYRLSLPEEIPVQELALDTDLADIFNISRKRQQWRATRRMRCCVSIASSLSTRLRIGAACNVRSSSDSWKLSASVLKIWDCAWTFNASLITSRSSRCTQPHSQ